MNITMITWSNHSQMNTPSKPIQTINSGLRDFEENPSVSRAPCRAARLTVARSLQGSEEVSSG